MDVFTASTLAKHPAERLLNLRAITRVLAFPAILISDHFHQNYLGVLLIFSTELSATLLLWKANAWFHLHRRLRQSALLKDALDITPPLALIDEFEAKIRGLKSPKDTEQYSSPYFNSNQPQGPNRLAENVTESAFYSARISRSAADKLQKYVASIFLLILLLLFAPVLAGGQMLHFWLLSLLCLLIISDKVTDYLDHTESASRFSLIETKGRTILTNEVSSNEAWLLFTEYQNAALLSPPLPNAIYLQNRQHLQILWQEVSPSKG